MKRCRILMTPLSGQKEQESGYSANGLKKLTGSTKVTPQLPFTREQFVHELPKKQQGMSISGYQPKLQLVLNGDRFAVVDYQGEFILKPSPAEFPQLAENEHATMMVMSKLGFTVPAHGLLKFKVEENGEQPEFAFVIKRFDRHPATGAPLHQEQLDAAMDIGEKYGKTRDDGKQYVSYERLALFLIEKVNDNLAFKMDLFRRVTYAWLLGNNDMHLRNFGLLLPVAGRPLLAPVYDFVSVAPYPDYFNASYLALPLLMREEGEGELAEGFKTAYGEYIGMDFLALGLSMGLSRALVISLLSGLMKEAELVVGVYNSSFMQAEAVERTLKCYQQRLKRLQLINEPLI